MENSAEIKNEHEKASNEQTQNGDVKQESENCEDIEETGETKPSVDTSNVKVEKEENKDDVKMETEDGDNVEEMETSENDADEKPVIKYETRNRGMRPEKKEVKKKNDTESEEEKEPESESLAAMKEKIASTKPAVEPAATVSSTGWHVICSTLDDWINLAEWYKDSPVRCEKALSKIIREDFLPVLPEIIEARVSAETHVMFKIPDLLLISYPRVCVPVCNFCFQ